MSLKSHSVQRPPQPDWKYVDDCLADYAWRRIQMRHADMKNAEKYATRDPMLRSKSQVGEGVSSRPVLIQQTGSVGRAVSFIDRPDKYNPKTRGAMSRRCPSCRTRFSLVTSSSGNLNYEKRKTCKQSLSRPPRKGVENRSTHTRSSRLNNKGNRRAERRQKEKTKRTETVSYQFR